MPDEERTHTEALMDSVSRTGAVVPPLFRIEVGNSLLIGVLRKRIASDYIGEALDLIGKLPLRIDRYTLNTCGAPPSRSRQHTD